ncbi:hypothetical protein IJ00_03760 [Calothrix sp. 336/3]|nr:hypothetical protein IJ00_03760 [Calothrix sp. 336/3]
MGTRKRRSLLIITHNEPNILNESVMQEKFPNLIGMKFNVKLPNFKIYSLVDLSNGKAFQPARKTMQSIRYFDYLMKTYVSR